MMKFKILISCECGNQDILIPKRTFVEYEGKVYEDYTSITDGVSEKGLFSLHQPHEDEITVTCKECGKTHDLTT